MKNEKDGRYLIYLDANIYLRFYNSNQTEYKKLLNSIIEISDSIFVSTQIVNEVLRNKSKVFKNSFDSYIKQAATINSIFLPEHLESSGESAIKKWNKQRKELCKNVKKQSDELDSIYKIIFEKIARSEDEVSNSLDKIFRRAIDANEIEYALARQRREKGNPPGKSEDPLGDQISWEQLLSRVHEYDELYLVTNDFDYLVYDGRKCLLNPLLYHEIVKKNKNLTIKCYNALSDVLREVNEKPEVEIKHLPDDKELAEISEEENLPIRMPDKVNYIFPEGITFDEWNNHNQIQRTTYLFKQALISKDDLMRRLLKFGVSQSDIQAIIADQIVY